MPGCASSRIAFLGPGPLPWLIRAVVFSSFIQDLGRPPDAISLNSAALALTRHAAVDAARLRLCRPLHALSSRAPGQRDGQRRWSYFADAFDWASPSLEWQRERGSVPSHVVVLCPGVAQKLGSIRLNAKSLEPCNILHW